MAKSIPSVEGVRSVERDVVAAACDQQEWAWRQLFDVLYPQMFRFFRSRVESAEAAEDLAAEVFVEAFRSRSRFRWRGRPFEAWLFGIARNRLKMHYRSRRETQELVGDVEHVQNEYLGVEIADVLDRLPPDYRAAIEYRYVLGPNGVDEHGRGDDLLAEEFPQRRFPASNQIERARILLPGLAAVPALLLLSFATFLLGPLAAFVLWIPRVRTLCALALIAMHLILEVLTNVGWWNYIMIGGLLAFLPPPWVARLLPGRKLPALG